MGGTISIVFSAKLIGFAAARGADPRPLWKSIGIEGSGALDPEARQAADVHADLWERIMRDADDPGLPIEFAQSFAIEDLHVMGFAVMTSADARQAIGRVCRYSRLLSEGGRWSLEEHGDTATVQWTRPGPSTLGQRCVDESAVATFLHTFRKVVGEQLVPEEVCFTHAFAGDTTAHRAFFGVRPSFRADYAGFRVHRRFLDLVPRTANPALATFFDARAEQLLPEATSEDIGSVVRTAITRELASGVPNMAIVARRLGQSERSLRRALSQESVSWRALVEDARLERARHLLRDSSVAIAEIGFLLGFADPSAFARFFKRTTGVSPRGFRQRADGPQADADATQQEPFGS